MSDILEYTKKLNKIIIEQSHNRLFYEGNVSDGAKELTKQVTESINTDRCSIWLYNHDETSIICQQLYIKSEDCWFQDVELHKTDFYEYFNSLKLQPIIIAGDAHNHPATSCFSEVYLKPLGINSMLDVPIIYRGQTIGVICIESLTKREWLEVEVEFAQMLSALYSFAHSVKEVVNQNNKIQETNKFIDESVLVTKADSKGNITYVNKKFTEVSGWTLEECLGKNHNIVNSGQHTKDFWSNMYKTTVKERNIWNKVVTNKTKNGNLYYVDSYIKAEFDESGRHIGYISIRQDVTDIKVKELEIQNQLSAINKSNLVIEFDLDGNILFANDRFLETMGFDYIKNGGLDEIVGINHANFVTEDYSKSEEYKDFWASLRNGKFISGEFPRLNKNGQIVWLKATYNPIIDLNGKVYKIMKLAVDITETYKQNREIEKLNENLKSILSSQTSYVLRTDMEGRHTYWNQKFEDEFGWVYEGNMMHGNSLLSICESHHGVTHDTVMKCIAEPGKIIKVELDKPHRDGSRRTTIWEFVCLADKSGNPTEVQCMGIDITERVNAEKKVLEVLKEVEKKNTYLEHAAKILRHDMHSGINTYIPRGVSSLERRLRPEDIQNLKIEAPLKMIKEGLKHTQKVYKGVYEFTNLVKKEAVLTKSECNIKNILSDYLSSTSYASQVILDSNLPTINVNEALFCTSIDNLIRNGLKYNDSDTKCVKVYLENNFICVEDNGRGMNQEEFLNLSKPYVRKEGQKESGTGLGLNICMAILEEHEFSITAEKLEPNGTKIKIKIK